MATVEELYQDISDKLKALGENRIDETRVRAIISEELTSKLATDSDFQRKMKFGKSDSRLEGSKFSRWGLTASDVEMVYDIMSSTRGMSARGGVLPGPSEELENAFRAISDAAYMTPEQVRAIDKTALDNVFPRVNRANRAQYEAALRAMDTAETGFGLQLIGAQYVQSLWEDAKPNNVLLNQVQQFEMTAPVAHLPVPGAMPEMTLVAEATSPTESVYTTVKTGSNRVTVTAKKFVIPQIYSQEMDEDAIIAFVPFLRQQAAYSLAYYTDSAILNGDTTNAGTGNINLDDADPADTKYYLAWDGIRHAYIVDNTGNKSDHSGAAITYDALAGLRKLMLDRTYLSDWGHPVKPDDVMYVTSPEVADKIALLDEVLTIDKYGQMATVVQGQVARIGQNPVISTIAMPLTEADGKVSTTAGNNTLGQVACFNKRGLVAGWRRRVQVNTWYNAMTDQFQIVFSLRLGLGRFSPTGAASGIEWAAGLYDISVA